MLLALLIGQYLKPHNSYTWPIFDQMNLNPGLTKGQNQSLTFSHTSDQSRIRMCGVWSSCHACNQANIFFFFKYQLSTKNINLEADKSKEPKKNILH